MCHRPSREEMRMASTRNPSLRLRVGRFLRWLWNIAIKPHPSITESGQRRQAQSLLVLALAFSMLLSVGLTVAFFLSGMVSPNPVMLALFVLSVLVYGIGRTQFFTWGAFLLVVA